jgi:hypothetical protein
MKCARHRTIKATGVGRIRPYDFRHTFASLLITAGKNPLYIARQMGHYSAGFTLLVRPVRWEAWWAREDLNLGPLPCHGGGHRHARARDDLISRGRSLRYRNIVIAGRGTGDGTPPARSKAMLKLPSSSIRTGSPRPSCAATAPASIRSTARTTKRTRASHSGPTRARCCQTRRRRSAHLPRAYRIYCWFRVAWLSGSAMKSSARLGPLERRAATSTRPARAPGSTRSPTASSRMNGPTTYSARDVAWREKKSFCTGGLRKWPRPPEPGPGRDSRSPR